MTRVYPISLSKVARRPIDDIRESDFKMMSFWSILWFAFIFMFLIAPLGYGWGYRSWGPPYPSYVQRRRHAAATSANSTFNHQAWGIGGDFIWVIMIIAVFALFGGFMWH